MPDLVVHAEGQGLCADNMDRHVASEHLEQGGAENGNLIKFSFRFEKGAFTLSGLHGLSSSLGTFLIGRGTEKGNLIKFSFGF